MSHIHHSSPSVMTARVPTFLPHATLAMGGVGAIIGGTASAAKNIRRVNDKEIDRPQAVRNVMKDSAGMGLATAAATAVVGAVGATGLLSLVGILAVATGAKYAWDSAMSPKKATVPATEPTEPKTKTSAESKTESGKKA